SRPGQRTGQRGRNAGLWGCGREEKTRDAGVQWRRPRGRDKETGVAPTTRTYTRLAAGRSRRTPLAWSIHAPKREKSLSRCKRLAPGGFGAFAVAVKAKQSAPAGLTAHSKSPGTSPRHHAPVVGKGKLLEATVTGSCQETAGRSSGSARPPLRSLSM